MNERNVGQCYTPSSDQFIEYHLIVVEYGKDWLEFWHGHSDAVFLPGVE